MELYTNIIQKGKSVGRNLTKVAEGKRISLLPSLNLPQKMQTNKRQQSDTLINSQASYYLYGRNVGAYVFYKVSM